MPMDHEYEWRLSSPADDLWFRMDNFAGGTLVHRAELAMQRRRITGAELARCLFTHPFMTGKVLASIYLQAFRLWRNIPVSATSSVRKRRGESSAMRYAPGVHSTDCRVSTGASG